ncbi:hypothetical protein ERX46_05190 [Brumimicrobium glaciale]|uniref:Lipocalin-like domain-containing protein n=1 Tax=Brumimicrobium glaciale TaxID=200475 RepID=A0A4Q4KP53_9FLAO|nr:hypothetical protein [Brumimicrobium glaciale]RYM34770.1 hypothetical protein ERX46_05190 [Brumimicrobium glaciale]
MNTIKRSKTAIISTIILLAFLFTSCDGDDFKKVSIDKFEGNWELQGRPMFDGVIIQIDKNKNGELKGKIVSLNENKFVQLFAEQEDTWISEISKISNYEFKLTEKKIGGALFSVYGLDTSKDFKVQFIDENTIGLSAGSSDPKTSTVKYIRVREDLNE